MLQRQKDQLAAVENEDEEEADAEEDAETVYAAATAPP
jgi:hypothetical protein